MGLGLFATISRYAQCDERQFAYTDLSDAIVQKDHVEIEQWATLREGKGEGKYARWDLRTELEYGLSDTWTGAIYINTTSKYSDGVSGLANTDSLKFDGLSLELKHMMQSRELNAFGFMPYFEITYSGKELELEQKLIIDRKLSENWLAALNIVSEQAWEYTANETENESKLILNGGISYQLQPTLSLGIEGSFRTLYDGFYRKAHPSAFFMGPAIHFATSHFQITASILKQLSNEHEDFEWLEARLITSVSF